MKLVIEKPLPRLCFVPDPPVAPAINPPIRMEMMNQVFSLHVEQLGRVDPLPALPFRVKLLGNARVSLASFVVWIMRIATFKGGGLLVSGREESHDIPFGFLRRFTTVTITGRRLRVWRWLGRLGCWGVF
jgi:hypothetical protein